jgi:hypothetical protein
LPLSTEATAAAYNFSKAHRDDGAKLYMGELSKNEGYGKTSPGPTYMYEDQTKFETVSLQIPKEVTVFNYRLQDGRWALEKESERISQSMTFTKMRSSLMTRWKLICPENQDAKPPKLALNLDSTAQQEKATQDPNTFRKKSQFTKQLKSIPWVSEGALR